MNWLRTIVTETFGLFVDDGAFAVAILAWLIVTGVVLPHAGTAPALKGPILFAGLAVILLESATRRARK